MLKLEKLPINMSHQTTPPTRIKRQQDLTWPWSIFTQKYQQEK